LRTWNSAIDTIHFAHLQRSRSGYEQHRKMTPDEILRDKLRKVEALFAGAATPGEKSRRGAAAGRIRQRLGQAAGKEKLLELKFSIPDVWSR
jgi:hypothetical protein